jgi:hypothetical protein
VIGEEPVDTIRFAAFFVRGEREDDVAVRLVIFLLQANQRGDQDGIAALHVLGTAAVEVAILLGELKGVYRPVFTARFDHVQVAHEQDWLLCACALQTDDEIAFAVVGADDLDVGCGETGFEKAAGHGIGCDRGAAN